MMAGAAVSSQALVPAAFDRTRRRLGSWNGRLRTSSAAFSSLSSKSASDHAQQAVIAVHHWQTAYPVLAEQRHHLFDAAVTADGPHWR